MRRFAPWTFAIALFTASAFVNGQAAPLKAMAPFGIALKLPAT